MKVPSALRSRRWLFLPPALIGIAIIAGFASQRKPLKRVPKSEDARALRVVRAQQLPVAPEVTGYGTIEAARTWTAIAEVGGRIVEIYENLNSGERVSEGTSLLRVDPTDYELAVRRSQAELAQAKAQRSELEARRESDETSLEIELNALQLAEEEVNRFETLRARNAASRSEYDQARTTLYRQQQTVQQLRNSLRVLPAQIGAAEAAIEMAEVRLAEARRDLERTRVVAPFSGVLADVNLELGQILNSAERLFDLQSRDVLEVEAQFSIAQLGRLFGRQTSEREFIEGEPIIPPRVAEAAMSKLQELDVTVVIRSGDIGIVRGATFDRIRESVNRQTRTIGLVFRLHDPKREIAGPTDGSDMDISLVQPGAFGEVLLRGPSRENRIAVPRSALHGDHLFVIDQESRLHRRPVVVDFANEDQVAISAGVNSGELVVISDPTPAIEGMRVEPMIVEWP